MLFDFPAHTTQVIIPSSANCSHAENRPSGVNAAYAAVLPKPVFSKPQLPHPGQRACAALENNCQTYAVFPIWSNSSFASMWLLGSNLFFIAETKRKSSNVFQASAD
jgi:hypothetical protein